MILRGPGSKDKSFLSRVIRMSILVSCYFGIEH